MDCKGRLAHGRRRAHETLEGFDCAIQVPANQAHFTNPVQFQVETSHLEVNHKDRDTRNGFITDDDKNLPDGLYAQADRSHLENQSSATGTQPIRIAEQAVQDSEPLRV